VAIVQAVSAENLDRQLPDLQNAARTLALRPTMGWIRSLRTALGMSATALAKRLRVSHSTLAGYEKAEQSGRIQLETLRRIADALDADLVVALIPRKSVQATLRDRAEAIARDEMQAVVQTMRLEDQEVSARATNQEFEQLVQDLVREPRKLWR
jgi:predicted DNA-binding mobile mystery protein A